MNDREKPCSLCGQSNAEGLVKCKYCGRVLRPTTESVAGRIEREKASAEAAPGTLSLKDTADRFAHVGGYALLGGFGAFIGFGFSFPLQEKHPFFAILVGLLGAVIGALVMMFGGNEFPFNLIKRPIQSIGSFLGYLVGGVYGLLTGKKDL
ncbi:MAG: hypothetical protein WCP55_14045 [Lentisphaerota bacterium]